MLDYFGKLNRNIIDQIQYRGTMVTGVITADNGDGTYAVKIAQADKAYPYVETAFVDMVFGVDEVVLITFEYGNKEMPRILGYAKRISQHPIDVVADYSGEGGDPITTVETLDAYSITGVSAYLEGRISLSEGIGNCTRRGFKYGLTTDYGSDVHEDGDYGEGAFALQISGLTPGEIYHFQAYVIDADDNEQIGEDKSFITESITEFLISCDYNTDTIYKHSGVSPTIIESFASPTVEPTGLAYDGSNLISCDWGSSLVHPKIYLHSGVTSTITDSFDSPDVWPRGQSGLTYDGSNLISCSQNGVLIYIHLGITSTISNSFASPSTAPCGLAYDSSNLISCDYDVSMIYKHSGITSTITESFASPSGSPYGLAYDGSNLISCDYGIDRIYEHSGISLNILDDFASPGNFPSGLAFEN